jgi:hypothetical protein
VRHWLAYSIIRYASVVKSFLGDRALTTGQLAEDLAAVIQPRVANAPKNTRRRRLLYGISLPDRGRAG